MKTKIKPSKTIARKVLVSVDHALCHGSGNGEGQNVCIMQAIARAVGLPVLDDHAEECVGVAVGAFNRRLNDCDWSTPKSRAAGMKRLAIASIGSNRLNQTEFGHEMFLQGTRKLLPFVFRKTADDPAIKDEQKIEYRKHADLCEKVETFEEAKIACKNASAYAYASDFAYAYAWFKDNLGNDFLNLIAETGVKVLKQLKSSGCKWLDLVSLS